MEVERIAVKHVLIRINKGTGISGAAPSNRSMPMLLRLYSGKFGINQIQTK